MSHEPKGLWSGVIPLLDENIAGLDADSLKSHIARAWPGFGEKIFNELVEETRKRPELLGFAINYARKNCMANGRQAPDLMDFYFGLIINIATSRSVGH